jgi:hypothetical protein
MAPHSDLQFREFFIVFESLPPDQFETVPNWTKIDQISQIDPAEFDEYVRSNYIDQDQPRSFLVDGRRIFGASRGAPYAGSPRTVTFSPRVDIQPIQHFARRYLAEKNSGNRSNALFARKPDTSTPLSQMIDDNQEEDLPKPKKRKNSQMIFETEELLYHDLFDLIPVDYDIMDNDLHKLYTAASTGNDCDSDSISYISSCSDDDE